MPIKILSAILYKEEAVIAIIAGIAYCVSNLPIGSVPNTNGEFVLPCRKDTDISIYFPTFVRYNLMNLIKWKQRNS